MAPDSPLTSPKAPGTPTSPSLLPPRKSVELVDAGAKDLDSSGAEEDDDVFSDAREALTSPKAVPLTRVEKVDDSPRHGQVPGTDAYEKRTKDAVPDEVEVIPEGQPSAPSSRRGSAAPPHGPSVTIPRTVVEKVDDSPSHGDVPGTPAHEMRKADSIPDSIVRSGHSTPEPRHHRSSPSVDSIPKTVVTRVDSEPRHGEIPGTEAFKKRMQDAKPDLLEKDEERPTFFSPVSPEWARQFASPIAADGGFGPMDYDGSEESEMEEQPRSAQSTEYPTSAQSLTSPKGESDADATEAADGADDFDDFEEGAEVDDFGDFDEGEGEDMSSEPAAAAAPPKIPIPATVPMFAIPDYTEASLDKILSSVNTHLDALFPATAHELATSPPSLPESASLFLSDRSHSLWSQLVAPPPLQPPNWVRSRIRRLFLVSLGVPVDLDEILPASKQKKLVLPYSGPSSSSKLDAAGAGDAASDSGAAAKSGTSKTKRRKGPAPPPEFDVAVVRALCATTDDALDNMSDSELRAHVTKLDELVIRGREVLQYWVTRKDAAVSEKEAFDGVIENLVQHIRHRRK